MPKFQSELSRAAALLKGGFPTCVQQVNYPVHQGKPNPRHGQFFFVGSIPADCWDPDRNNGPFSPPGGSRFYPTEEAAIRAAIAAGVERIQRCDCSFVNVEDYK